MRNRFARAFAVLSCGCLLLGSCEADRISVQTEIVEPQRTSAAAGVSVAAAMNFDKMIERAETQGLLDVGAQADRTLQEMQERQLGLFDVTTAEDGDDNGETEAEASVVLAEKKADTENDSDEEKAEDGSAEEKTEDDSAVLTEEKADKEDSDANEADEAAAVTADETDDADGDLLRTAKKDDGDDAGKDGGSDTYGYKNIGIANVHTSLNVREKASKSSRRIGSMLPDAACEIKGYEGDWAKIKSGDVTGYVMSSYLLVDEEAQQRADLLMSDSVTVNADVLRVRESASINSRIITRVNGGTKLVLADSGESGAESVQNSKEKQEQSGAPPGDEREKSSKSVEKSDNSDDFASVKVKDSIEVAKQVESDDGKSGKQTEKQKETSKAPPDGDAAFDDATDVRAVDEIGDNGWVEIELGNGRYGYVSTDYVEVSTELATASALYAPDPIEETAPAVTVADVTVSENVTVATERVEDDVSADSDSGGSDDGAEDDPGGGASEDDSGIATAPEADTDGGDANVTDSDEENLSDDGSKLTEDEQTDAEEESEDHEKAGKDGKKKHNGKTDEASEQSEDDGQTGETGGMEKETADDSGSDDASVDTSAQADNADAAEETAPAEDETPSEGEETAPVAPVEGAGTSDPASFAMQFLGNPYVWGGSSLTNGADCSGFVMSVYANYGISLPHSSAAQAAYGTRISAAEAVPGDLFFYGSGRINHVGIYVGNGQIIHASNRRTGIKLSSAYYQTPVCVTRLMN